MRLVRPSRRARAHVGGLATAGHAAALGGILAVAAVARFIHLGPGLFDDEVYSVEVAKHGLGGIVHLVEQTDTHPPLSYFVLHFWMQAFGTSEVAVRSLSAAWSLGTVLIIYLVGRLLWSSQVGLIAAILLALSQYNVAYAHYARMYSMMGFFSALSFYYLARLHLQPSRRNALLYILASAVLIYTHVWGVFLVLSQSVAVVVVVALRRSPDSARVLRRWLLLQAGLLAIWTPWLATGFRHQIQTTLHDNSLPYGNLADYRPPSAHAVVNAAYVAANTHPLGLLFVAIVGAAVAAAATATFRAGVARPSRSRIRALSEAALGDPRLVMLAAWYLVPLTIGVVASYAITPVFLQRYAIGTTLPVYLAVAVAVTRLPTRTVGVVALLLTVGFATRSVESYAASLSDFFRAPAQYIQTHAKPNDVVLYDMPAIVFDYYAQRNDLHGTHVGRNQLDLSFITLLRDRRDAIDPALRDPYTKDSMRQDLHTIAAASRYKRVWLLLESRSQGQLRESTAVRRLGRAFGPPRLATHVGSFDVFLFAR